MYLDCPISAFGDYYEHAFRHCTSIESIYLLNNSLADDFYELGMVRNMFSSDFTESSSWSIFVKQDLYDSSKDVVISGSGAYVFTEISNGYAEYLWDSSYGQDDDNSSDSCS